ncbi:multicopper oxidase [Streptomyces sp. RB6PN25]|uniref:Multicopper oxidase n=1 Tax=Streptomyces humicola TaxID=2953240 RepID=A0ABT1Q4E3_9ACTN|nr:multicopper oxidase [Streptomyces humicola]MCQ4084798.1 multicopper oxidase [Streptomyces humicola]
MISRRYVLKAGVIGGGCLFLPKTASQVHAPTGAMDPVAIEKYVTELLIPPVMPWDRRDRKTGLDSYTIGVRQFRQQILPPGQPATTVWGYGSTQHPETFNAPSFTIEAEFDQAVRVTWVNQLRDCKGNYLPHLLPVDPTLHWAYPPGGMSGRDSRPTYASTPGPYTGPVPIVTHLHGGQSSEESDGYAEAWYLPNALGIPAGYAPVGSFYRKFGEKFEERFGQGWSNGEAVFQYANRERASTLWFHDHALGITRLNVYAGLAGFYLLRGGPDDLPPGVLPGPAPKRGDAPTGRFCEIPIVIQDRSFNTDGSLFYPASRAFADGFKGPYIPGSDIPPIWNPEFFGNTLVTNGRTWPVLPVEPRRYRFRFLNGCNSRYLVLKIVADRLAHRPVPPALPFWQIGSEGGFLPAPVERDQLLIAPAERADVIVDYTSIPVGTDLYLINEGPDSAYQGGKVGTDFAPAEPRTTGQVMKFTVKPLTSPDTTVPPRHLTLPALTPIGPASRTRQVSLNEEKSARLNGVGTRAVLLGTLDPNEKPVPMRWADPITENPALGATEIWEIHNLTADAHPIHIHEVQFQVVDRQPTGQAARAPEPWENGFKDTVITYPNGVTRVRVKFDQEGRYMWHCHMLDHEDNEMMRPYHVGPLT